MATEYNPAEEAVEAVLKKLKKAEVIRHYIRNKKNDRLDSEGIDFLIIEKDGRALPLQVKTWNRKTKSFRLREHLKKHEHIRFVIFVDVSRPEPEALECLKQKLLQILNRPKTP